MEHMGMCNTDFSIFSKVFPVPDLWGNFQRSHIDLTVQFILNYYPTLWFMCFFSYIIYIYNIIYIYI